MVRRLLTEVAREQLVGPAVAMKVAQLLADWRGELLARSKDGTLPPEFWEGTQA